MDDDGWMHIDETFHFHGIEPFEGANIEKAAIEFNGIDPFNPLRGAVSEKDALGAIFKKGLRKGLRKRIVIGPSSWRTTPHLTMAS